MENFPGNIRLLGYYHFPNQKMNPEPIFVEDAKELALLISQSLNSLLSNEEVDDELKKMITTDTVFVFKNKEGHLYAYFTKDKIARISDVRFSKKDITQVSLKYKSWFLPGRDIKLWKEIDEPSEITTTSNMENKTKIAAPKISDRAKERVFDNMYITNVEKRLRELNSPSDIDRKRWIWELVQNAKDTISGNPNRDSINVRIEIDGDEVRFRHDGDPFTADARYALLYKYSEEKENQSSTGRFGTGFLTTHCLSKIVTIESNMFTDDERTQTCGFSVTMYRDGLIKKELIEGLNKMRESEEFYTQTFPWTTFIYKINSESGRRAVELGVENFYENISATMLFCKELSSVVLDNNGKITSVTRKEPVKLNDSILLAEFQVSGDRNYTKRFLVTSNSEYNQKLSDRYRAERDIRVDAAIEIDATNNLVNHEGKTSFFCVLPMVGIESQLNEPIIVNSPDFEPDSERQSLLLSGRSWNDEKNCVTESGINQMIYDQILPLFENIVSYLAENKYGHLYYLANGLKVPKKHKELDADWYKENVIEKYRDILCKYCVIEPYQGEEWGKINDCIFAEKTKESDGVNLLSLVAQLYPNKLAKHNDEWSSYVWKSDNIQKWDTESLCEDIASKKDITSVETCDVGKVEWYNSFLSYISFIDERLLKEYALIPNMNGDFLAKDSDGFKQGEHVTDSIIELLQKLGKDVKPLLLSRDITSITLESKYNSTSYSSDINHLAEAIVKNDSIASKLNLLMPLLSIYPTKTDDEDFITRRHAFFGICKDLYAQKDYMETSDENLLNGAWEAADKWFVTNTLQSLHNLGNLNKLPEGLDAAWLNKALKSLNVSHERLNTYSVLPNQYGDFCKQENLYNDNGVPEVLKCDIFSSIDSINYKKWLLDKNITAQNFAVTQKLGISDFASDLKDCFSQLSSSQYGNHFRGSYHKYSQEILDKIALYMVSVLPTNKSWEYYTYQENTYELSKDLLAGQCYPEESIDYEKIDLWKDADEYVGAQLSEKISELGSVQKLNEKLEDCGEVKVFEVLNKFYAVKGKIGYGIICSDIYPNQEGTFRDIDDLKREDGNIGERLKDIIALLVPEDENYRYVLADKRMKVQPQSELTIENAYSLVDGIVNDKYQNPTMWEDENYIEAVHQLIEVWSPETNLFTRNNFPKTEPLKDSIVLNVVWKKAKRELLMDVSKTFTDEELRRLINNGSSIGELSTRVQSLEEENEQLRRQLEAMGGQVSTKPVEGDDTADNDVEIVIKPKETIKINVSTPFHKGELAIREAQYSGLSLDEIKAYVSEAKRAVVEYFEKLGGYTFREERIRMDSYSQLYGVYDPNGDEVPLVVHSYRGPQYRYFDLNWFDWQLLQRPNSKLFIQTTSGLQCIPLYALPVRSVSMGIESQTNIESRAALLTLARAGQDYSGVSFSFGNNMPTGFTELRNFDFVPEQLNTCIGSIKELCDANKHELAKLYNSRASIPLIDTPVNYAASIGVNMSATLTTADLHDLPAAGIDVHNIQPDNEDLLY